MTKRVKIVMVAAASVVVLAGYFVVLPNAQATDYTNKVKPAHTQLSTKVIDVSKVLGKDAFVKTDVELSQIETDIKSGRDAIKEAENTLGQTENDLTGFGALPLLDWNSKYKAAKELKANEQKYVDETRAYINELKAVLDYMEQSLALEKAVTEYMNQVDLVDQKSETYPEFGAMLDQPLSTFEAAVNKTAELKAPASVKEMHEFSVTAARQLMDIDRKLIAAAKADNEDLMIDLAIQEQEKLNELATKGEELNSKFIKESPLHKMSDRLNELNRTLSNQLNG